MAGWSMLTDGSALDCVVVGGCKDSGGCLPVDHVVGNSNEHEIRLRCLFDQVLSVFWKEAASRGCIRPLPPMLGDGRSPDLFELFLVVRERGGFDTVSRDSLWCSVAMELGLDDRVSPSVKLIYLKYLNELERWLRGNFRDSRLGNKCECGGHVKFLSLELETEFRDLLKNAADQKRNDNRFDLLEYKKTGFGKDIRGSEINLPNSRNGCKRYGDNKKTEDDDEKACKDPSLAKKLVSTRKRKRESLSGMLNWVTHIAKYPFDPSIEAIPDASKWKDHKGKEYWFQAIRAREALLQGRHLGSNIEQPRLQSNQKMHPSMYEDRQDSTGRVRCNGRLPAVMKCSASQSKSRSPQKTESQNGFKEQASEEPSNTTLGLSEDQWLVRHVPVGPRFQAEIPEWTGVASDSDSKWLGTRIWPLKFGEGSSLHETDLTRRAKLDSCNCHLPGSVECVRFHIAENRMKLKRELGSVFYQWRFDRMGEEESLRWTAREEKTFKDMVTLHSPSPSVRFWDKASKFFPTRTREELVSYYFNVFLVQRRSYQNRVTPKKIDSDDESEFGSVSFSFGHEAVKVQASKNLICYQNNQLTDLE